MRAKPAPAEQTYKKKSTTTWWAAQRDGQEVGEERTSGPERTSAGEESAGGGEKSGCDPVRPAGEAAAWAAAGTAGALAVGGVTLVVVVSPRWVSFHVCVLAIRTCSAAACRLLSLPVSDRGCTRIAGDECRRCRSSTADMGRAMGRAYKNVTPPAKYTMSAVAKRQTTRSRQRAHVRGFRRGGT